jgi:shikimate kinase
MIPPSIVLIGFRGTGKSTLARHLAQTLGWERVSTDERVTVGILMDGAGESIADFVERMGWSAFREREYNAVATLESSKNIILDCGGGVVEREDTMVRLATFGVIVWVHAELDDVLDRLTTEANAAQRPRLSHADWAEDIRENFTRRLPLYERYADFQVSTSIGSIEECAEGIVWHYEHTNR